MRTTVTLDSDVEQMLRERMAREGVSFKRALNDAVRAGVPASDVPQVDFSTSSVSLGRPIIDLDRALQVASELDDADTIAKLRAGR
ncbi:antitoxin [Occultella kanbiaonis]|uniref:antitoxin n=1 Tax=Occultella kanbiaonis TaxID=2675754 RepID=UPI0013D4AFF2|nr:antitoxin [Occultella kanbiaonis]